jgi:L-arabinose isomerase
MREVKALEAWFVTGSQHLYGQETLRQVTEHSRTIANTLSEGNLLPVKIIFKPVLTTPEAIFDLCTEANGARNCIGLIIWMHTFSPAKMWIAGLTSLKKPFAHLHTQFNCNLPWSTIDMDFMNLNQSAHGDREFGFIASRLRLRRKVIVGFWQDPEVIASLAAWSRAGSAWDDAQTLKVARFGDNMREVAVTEGDKVAAQRDLRYTVSGYGVGDLVAEIDQVTHGEIEQLVSEYRDTYSIADKHNRVEAIREAAQIELGFRAFLSEGNFGAFTDTFQDLRGLKQLPGIAVQRLMASGYGFGAEGDWKTAALVRAMKVMAQGLPGGTSFMEDYTYDFGAKGKVLGAHMLEVCPSITTEKPALEIHPLSIGGKADPVRLVFTASPGPAILVSIVDVGNRFRMIVNEVDVVAPDKSLPKLPVAKAVWVPKPNLKIAASAWIYAGGAHHTSFSQALQAEHLEDFAEMAGIEFLQIDSETRVQQFKRELMWNDSAYLLARGQVV